jgi:hypothetical protein
MSTLGLTIEGKHTYDDWRLNWIEPYTLDPPPAKTKYIDIPAGDGSLDISEALSERPLYDDRTILFLFSTPDKDYYQYEAIKAELNALLHGQRREVRSDLIPGYYLTARLEVRFTKESKAGATMELSGTASPYWRKVNLTTVASTALASPGRSLALPNEQMMVVPEITTANALTIKDGTRSIAVPAGTSRVPSFTLPDGGKTVSLIGSGAVSFKYREGRL